MHSIFVKRLHQLVKLVKVLAYSGYRAALRRSGVAAAVEHEKLLKTFKFATVVDIGANRGQFALVARRCFPKARIISFEPLAGPAERYRTALGDDPLTSLHQVAIGPATAIATMHVAAEDDSSSLLPITQLQEQLSGTREIAIETIDVDSLAHRIKEDDLHQPALLKIDVQGYELPVLKGCDALLSRFSQVYVECSFVELYKGQALASQVIEFLARRGYRFNGDYNVQYGRDGRAIQADMLFSRPVNSPRRNRFRTSPRPSTETKQFAREKRARPVSVPALQT
jgi:FkbM family methyltransferase